MLRNPPISEKPIVRKCEQKPENVPKKQKWEQKQINPKLKLIIKSKTQN
jgi:hypothetical protein